LLRGPSCGEVGMETGPCRMGAGGENAPIPQPNVDIRPAEGLGFGAR